MQIKILQEGKKTALPPNDETRIFLRTSIFGSYNYKKDRYEKKWLVSWDESIDFVGILCLKNTIYLSLPKTAAYHPAEDKMELLLKYGKLLEQYFAYVDWRTDSRMPPWLSHRKDIAEWCKNPVPPKENRLLDKFIAVVKFENVFAWMVSAYLENQIHLERKSVFFESHIVKWWVDLDEGNCRSYEWHPVRMQTDAEPVSDAEAVSYAVPRQNFPDVAIDGECEGRKYCAVIDANYYDWDAKKDRYFLSADKDLYQQFFYRELFGKIYQSDGHTDVEIYSLLFLPDYLRGTKEWMSHCANVVFPAQKDHVISVWRICTDRLIDEILSEVQPVSRESFVSALAAGGKEDQR
jgi:hypothetical protein